MVYLLSSLGCLPPVIFCSKKPAGATWAKKMFKKKKRKSCQFKNTIFLVWLTNGFYFLDQFVDVFESFD